MEYQGPFAGMSEAILQSLGEATDKKLQDVESNEIPKPAENKNLEHTSAKSETRKAVIVSKARTGVVTSPKVVALSSTKDTKSSENAKLKRNSPNGRLIQKEKSY